MVFRALFCPKYISNQDDILQEEALSERELRRKRTQNFKIINKSIMTEQKCKNILLQAAVKDF